MSYSPQQPLHIFHLPVSSLKPDPRNPRIHSKKQIKQIERSIKSYGFNVPVLIDGESKIIAGHGRVIAATNMGMTELPAIRLEHLSKAQAIAFQIADNKLTENGEWNEPLLAELFLELPELEMGIDMTLTGFEMPEIDLIIENLQNPDADKKDDAADQLPATGVPVCKAGDKWQLGPHTIVCGNSLEISDYEKLMSGQTADMIITDPPYNVPIDGHVCGNGSIKHREFAMAVGEMTKEEFIKFLKTALGLAAQFSTDGSIHYVFMDWRHMEEILAASQHIYSELKNLCVWNKDNAGMGSFYRSQHELIFVFKKGNATHQNNFKLGQYGRHRSNIWQYPGIGSFGRNTEDGNLLALHPTVKPVKMIADAILDCSSRGNIILDCFLGSGTTLLAAERTGRHCYGMELDPLYVDCAIRRWQSLTGEDAIDTTSGKTFSELEASHAPS
jgi:DNA modification methylase